MIASDPERGNRSSAEVAALQTSGQITQASIEATVRFILAQIERDTPKESPATDSRQE